MYQFLATTVFVLFFSGLAQANPNWINQCDGHKDKSTVHGDLLAVLFDDYEAESCAELYDYLSQETEIDLTDYNLRDFSMITEFQNVTELSVAINPVRDLSFLKRMPNLEVVDLSGCQFITEAPELEFLPNLKEAIFELGGLRKAPSFHNQARLDSLDLSFNPLTDLTGLEGQSVREINLTGSELKNIDSLAYLRDVEIIILDMNELTSIMPLKDLTTLRELSVDENVGISLDLGGSQMPSLELLSSYESEISTVSALSAFPNLRFLNLSRNKIVDVSGLEKLNSLKKLYLNDNAIKDVTSFKKAFHLETLDLRDNPLNDVWSLLDLIQNGTKVYHEDLDDDVF